MNIPFFYNENLSAEQLTLDEDTSKHVISVLRLKKGDKINLTDGRGTKAQASVIDENRKRCTVSIESRQTSEKLFPRVTIAISLVKNTSRFEWFLEKATEIGVTEIIPMLCERTEKEKFRIDRMKNILVSAMLQSQQSWLPGLHGPTVFEEVIRLAPDSTKKYIAHCLPTRKNQLSTELALNPGVPPTPDLTILIGPEGDFTETEISVAMESGFAPVALGNTRLRTETAGIVAAVLLRQSGITR